jgi:hypothetical protein
VRIEVRDESSSPERIVAKRKNKNLAKKKQKSVDTTSRLIEAPVAKPVRNPVRGQS